MAAALEQEMLRRGVSGIDRAECREILQTVMQRTVDLGEGFLAARRAEHRPEKGH
jgi:hypothetical protein